MAWGLSGCLVDRVAWVPAISGGEFGGRGEKGSEGVVHPGLEAQAACLELSRGVS